MSELSKIVAAAKIEGAQSTSEPVGVEASFPDPDFSAIADDQLDTEAKRYTLRELARRLREDYRLSGLREKYAERIFILTVAWLIVVITVVVFSGFSLPDRSGFFSGLYHVKFELPEAVLIAFIGTTTVNVIALFLAVTAWLFPKDAGVHVDPDKTK